MEAILQIFIEQSPVVALMAWLWWINRIDYKELIDKTQAQNEKREERYQNTIDKLTEKLNIVDDVSANLKTVKLDVKDLKREVTNVKKELQN